MKLHPAIIMMLSWLFGFALFLALPFSLENRTMTLYGYAVLTLFLAVFCGAALAATRPMPQAPRDPDVVVDFRRADQILVAVCLLCVLVLLIDLRSQNIFDLSAAYEARSARSSDLTQGVQSSSSIWFQIGFLTYPAGYIYLIREVGFRRHPNFLRLGLFGLAPPVLIALAMGGRGPMFFAVVYPTLAYLVRQQVFPAKAAERAPRLYRAPDGTIRKRRAPFRFGPISKAATIFVSGLATLYFAMVFTTRAQAGGGVDAVFDRIGLDWGVGFNGHGADVFYSLFGAEGSYMIFVFAWYWIQGIVMSNQIFSDYDGPMLLGTYGIDLVSAFMRRFNSEFTGAGFAGLLQMNVYGFLPSAFGSLFVDLKFFGLIPVAIWGYLAGVVYRNVRLGRDPRWLLLVPVVTLSIIMSMNNTPLGLSNGLVLHFWMLVAFFLARRVVIPATSPAPAPAAS